MNDSNKNLFEKSVDVATVEAFREGDSDDSRKQEQDIKQLGEKLSEISEKGKIPRGEGNEERKTNRQVLKDLLNEAFAELRDRKMPECTSRKARAAPPKAMDAIVSTLQALRQDNVDRELATALFQFKDLLLKSGVAIPPRFKRLFIEHVCAHLLNDLESPGEIDEGESRWLRWCMQGNRVIDRIDQDLLSELKARSLNYPAILEYKGPVARKVEAFLSAFQHLTWFAIVGSLIAAFALFVSSTVSLFIALCQFGDIKWQWLADGKIWLLRVCKPEEPVADLDSLVQCLVSSVDEYLFAMVLLIFGIGIYSLFISKRDQVEDSRNYRPKWLHVANIDDLKSSLGNSILMALIVAIYKFALKLSSDASGMSAGTPLLNLLYFAGAIVLVAYSLHLVHAHHAHSPEAKQKPHAYPNGEMKETDGAFCN